jgi:hypothetical protein
MTIKLYEFTGVNKMPQILQIFGVVVATHRPMITLLAAIASLLSFRIRSRTSLD